MLTPRFTLSQTATHVYVTVSVPSLRIRSSEEDSREAIEIVVLEQSELHFSAAPYFLKLNFAPYQIQDDHNEEVGQARTGRAQYNPDDQTIVIPLAKKRPMEEGEGDQGNRDNFWPNLELTARLIQPKEIPKQWLHAVVDKDENSRLPTVQRHDDVLAGDSEEKGCRTTLLSSSSSFSICDGYGFANMFHNIFRDYARSGLALEMLQLARANPTRESKGDEDVCSGESQDKNSALPVDPDQTTLEQRRQWRQEQESQQDFDLERYVQDMQLFQNDDTDDDDEDYMIPLVREYVPWWKRRATTSETSTSNREDDGLLAEVFSAKVTLLDDSKAGTTESSVTKTTPTTTTIIEATATPFDEEERLLLSTIPYPLIPKSLVQSTRSNYKLWCGLLDLLFAYTYDDIMTTGDPTVESAWTISILSPSLSWLDPPYSVNDVCITFLRRCLCYPYWRSLAFAVRHVMENTLQLVHAGIPSIVKALLQIRTTLEHSECYYLGNKLFVDPYLYWIQRQNDNDGILCLVQELSCFLKQDDTVIRDSLGLPELAAFHDDSCDEEDQEESYTCVEDKRKDKADSIDSNITSTNTGQLLLDDLVG